MLFSAELVDESRRMKALSGSMTPLKKDLENQTFYFIGSSGDIYTTTLDECTCPDFSIQGQVQPCKHMIRMAMELGYYPNDGMMTDLAKVNSKYYHGVLYQFILQAPLDEAIKAIQIIKATFSTNKANNVTDDSLSFAGVPSMEETGLFMTHQAKKKIIPVKSEKKQIDGLVHTLIFRLGNFAYDNLDNESIQSLIYYASEHERHMMSYDNTVTLPVTLQ